MGTASKHGSPVEDRHEACGELGVVDRSDVDASGEVDCVDGRVDIGGRVRSVVSRESGVLDAAVSPGVRRDELGEASAGSPSG